MITLDWHLGHILIDLTDVFIKHNPDVFQFAQEHLQYSLVLFRFQTVHLHKKSQHRTKCVSYIDLFLEFVSCGVCSKQSFLLGDKLIEGVARLDEDYFSTETQIWHIIS